MTKEIEQENIDEILYPETAKEALDKFEKGEVITVVELGRLGPRYEQAIWFSIFELIKKCHKEDVSKWVDEKGKIKKSEVNNNENIIDDKLRNVCGGLVIFDAQAEIIKKTTFQLLMYGWRNMMLKAPKDNMIQISNDKMMQIGKIVSK